MSNPQRLLTWFFLISSWTVCRLCPCSMDVAMGILSWIHSWKTIPHKHGSKSLKLQLMTSTLRKRTTYDLILHISIELMDFSRSHQEVPAPSQRLQQLLKLMLHHLPPPIHLLCVLHLLTQSLDLALQLHHLPLTHLHLVLQHLQVSGT